MKYDFLIETCKTERIRVLSVRSEFRDEDLRARPSAGGPARAVAFADRCGARLSWIRGLVFPIELGKLFFEVL
jgi:hypothetical protein